MKSHKSISTIAFLVLVMSACAPLVEQAPIDEQTTEDIPSLVETEAESPEETTPTSTEVPIMNANPPTGAQREFSTDFSISAVSFDEILSGGPPKDGIPSIDDPKFIRVEDANEWIGTLEPIIQVSINQEVKGYPIQILTWHEIVNDTVGGVPVVVTFCPLCNTAIAFERTVDNQVLDFGTTGRLRFSNLIMYDRQTETWWQQGTGEGIVGSLTGTQLEFVPAAMISWEEFKNANPDSLVLSRETGYVRSYGRNPYVGYDNINNPPFLYQGPTTPGQLPPVARVLALEFDGEAAAYPYQILSEVNVVNDRVGDQDVAIFWAPGTASALDTSVIEEGQDVGSAIAYDRNIDGQLLTFEYDGENIIDAQTGSTWDILGRAVSGPLSGTQLSEVVSVNHLWFSWAAFKPETRIYQPDL
ncbi:MAG: DUF3179 domain-containing protein [Brevefilum sp.]|nr:DUF3179 domain-containing protein [Brevefilum sp.]